MLCIIENWIMPITAWCYCDQLTASVAYTTSETDNVFQWVRQLKTIAASRGRMGRSSRSPCNKWFLRPTWVSMLNSTSFSSAAYCRAHACDQQTDRQTDRPRYSVCSNRPHLRPNNNNSRDNNNRRHRNNTNDAHSQWCISAVADYGFGGRTDSQTDRQTTLFRWGPEARASIASWLIRRWYNQCRKLNFSHNKFSDNAYKCTKRDTVVNTWTHKNINNITEIYTDRQTDRQAKSHTGAKFTVEFLTMSQKNDFDML